MMETCIITWLIMAALYTIGESLKCFECDNTYNPACGVDFKAYQYDAHLCKGQHTKCGLQRQKEIGDFIGIIRRCHVLGSVKNLNESDGCHVYLAQQINQTFEICLCSDDYCNSTDCPRYSVLVMLSAYVLRTLYTMLHGA